MQGDGPKKRGLSGSAIVHPSGGNVEYAGEESKMNAIVAVAPSTTRSDSMEGSVIERRPAPSAEQFRSQYLAHRRPVVLTGLADAWLARNDYRPARFRAQYGTMRVLPVAGQAPTISEVLDRIERQDPANPAPYPARIDLDRMAPALRAEFEPRYAGSLPDRLADPLLPTRLFEGYSNYEMFFGGPNARFPYLHYDYFHVHTWVTQLHGHKTFVMYAPEDAELLYPRADEPWQSSIPDIERPDYARFPRFREARAHVVTLGPGDTLFVPTGWWHTTRADELNISVAWGQLGPDNWSEFVGDVRAIARGKAGRPLEYAVAALLAAIGAASRLRE